MRSVTYSMNVSLDGDIVGPDGDFAWTPPDEEVFRSWIDEIRGVGAYVLGRRLYETDSQTRSSGCERSRGRATSRSAARRWPRKRPRWI